MTPTSTLSGEWPYYVIATVYDENTNTWNGENLGVAINSDVENDVIYLKVEPLPSQTPQEMYVSVNGTTRLTFNYDAPDLTGAEFGFRRGGVGALQDGPEAGATSTLANGVTRDFTL